jgi:serine/threonine protein phosphatase 1
MNRLFAISDIHGCFKPFYELVNKTIKLTKSDQLFLLGDYIDRGEQSKEVIDFIIDLGKEGFNVTTLIGNHEVMLLDSYRNRELEPIWFMNNGATTLLSFGIEDIRDIDKHYLEFLESLEYYRIVGDIIFVHAGFNDQAINPFADRHSMIWESPTYYRNPIFSGKTIIHGHRPNRVGNLKKMIDENASVISIDTGCVYEKEMGYGILTALEINTMKLYSVLNSYI